MTLQQDVEGLLSDSLDGYGLIENLLQAYSTLRSRASFELQARQRFIEEGFLPELGTYITTITSISDMTQADLEDLLQRHEQARQRSREENQAIVTDLQQASQDLNEALQNDDYHRGVYDINRIMQYARWEPIRLGNVVQSLEAMKGISDDLHAVDKHRSRLMVAYFNDLIDYGGDVVKDARRQNQEPYRGDLSPEMVAKALFGRYEEVDLEAYKEPIWARASQRIGQFVRGIRDRVTEEEVLPEVTFQPVFLTYLPTNFRRLNQLVAQEHISAGWLFTAARQRRKALKRARELGVDFVVPFKALNYNPVKAFEFYSRI